jgi:hypothetical protein
MNYKDKYIYYKKKGGSNSWDFLYKLSQKHVQHGRDIEYVKRYNEY